MSFVRLEDLFVAIVFAIVAVVSAWAVTDADDVSPLLSSATVAMERHAAADELEPAVAAPREVAARPGAQRVCPCCAAGANHTRDVPPQSSLPPRPPFLDGDGSNVGRGPVAKCQTTGCYQR